ncbi:MAG TPA: hypothetical protein VGG49_07725 [Steroidobacteraceae bacterium]|jgi:hypothetical protein
MPFHIRSRNGGKSFELRITHAKLDQPVYRTCTSKADAEHVAADALYALDRGHMPDWLVRADQQPLGTIAQAINVYRAIGAVPDSTDLLLDTSRGVSAPSDWTT